MSQEQQALLLDAVPMEDGSWQAFISLPDGRSGWARIEGEAMRSMTVAELAHLIGMGLPDPAVFPAQAP